MNNLCIYCEKEPKIKYQGKCRQCFNAYINDRYQDPEIHKVMLKQSADWQRRNPEYGRDYKKNNLDKGRKYFKKWHENNKFHKSLYTSFMGYGKTRGWI